MDLLGSETNILSKQADLSRVKNIVLFRLVQHTVCHADNTTAEDGLVVIIIVALSDTLRYRGQTLFERGSVN